MNDEDKIGALDLAISNGAVMDSIVAHSPASGACRDVALDLTDAESAVVINAIKSVLLARGG